MTAAWHLGPITGWELWRVLVTSPEILVFLFFMITDPRTIPTSTAGRRAYAIAVGFLAALLIAPWTSEFSAKVAVLGALAIVCAARPLLLALQARGAFARVEPSVRPRVTLPLAAAAACGALVVAGLPARPAAAVAAPLDSRNVPDVTILASQGLAPIDRATGRRIAADLVADLDHAARGTSERATGSARAGARRAPGSPSSGDGSTPPAARRSR